MSTPFSVLKEMLHRRGASGERARWLGRDSGQARRFCLEAWRTTRPLLLDRRVCPPRIWST
jgi:hypothetical protein